MQRDRALDNNGNKGMPSVQHRPVLTRTSANPLSPCGGHTLVSALGFAFTLGSVVMKPAVRRCQPALPQALFRRGCPSLSSSSAPAARSSAATWKKCWGSSCFFPAINFPLCFLIYWGMNCLNRTVSCSLRFISLHSFQFVFISIIIRALLTWPIYFYQIYEVMDERRCSVNMVC